MTARSKRCARRSLRFGTARSHAIASKAKEAAMKILIMGAGGVGAYYGARLQQAGEEVVFGARGENLQAMREHGLEIQSYKGDLKLKVTATDDPKEFAPYGLVLFAVKSYDTEAAAKQLVGTLAPDGILMTIQNGVENEEILCRYFPRESVMGGNSRVGAEVIAPGKVMHTAIGAIEFGELDGRITPRAEHLAEIFQRAGILGELTTDLKTIRWYKLMGNNGTNPVCALSLSTIGQILGDEDGYELSRTLMAEAITVGRAEGANVNEDRIEMQLQGIKKHPNAFKIKPSTLQDLE